VGMRTSEGASDGAVGFLQSLIGTARWKQRAKARMRARVHEPVLVMVLFTPNWQTTIG
jgi:hypothetical protein